MWLLAALFSMACTPSSPPVAPAEPSRLVEALGQGVIARAPLDALEGPASPFPGYTVRPVSLQVYPDFRVSGALWLPEGGGKNPAVLMAHGHFGEGKSSGEAQGPAHVFATNGYAVLALDTPGVEEGDRAGRRIHFDEGAHGRALLAAAGSSAMAVQLDGLQAGLDYLSTRSDIGPIAVTGASGGSVQAFLLLFVDPRPVGAVLASFVPMPREARAGGCPCDTLPGWPGPDASLLAAVPKPTLWLSELVQERPDGLPRNAGFTVVEGPHGYDAAMVKEALPWLDRHLDHRSEAGVPDRLPNAPSTLLQSASVGAASFSDLLVSVADPPPSWEPRPRLDVPYTLDCRGEGAVIVVAGGDVADSAALVEGGFRACLLSVTDDEAGLAEAIALRGAYVDRFAGALRGAVMDRGASGVYAVRGWGLAARGIGVPRVERDPLLRLEDVDSGRDPVWVHAPGVWWTPMSRDDVLASGSEPTPLVDALRGAVSSPKTAETPASGL